MIKAILMCGDLFLGVKTIKSPQAVIRLERSSIASIGAISVDVGTWMNSTTNMATSSTMEIIRNTLIFVGRRQVGHDAFEYQFSHEQSSHKYKFEMFDRVEELDVATEKVNLNILAAKMRDNLKTKELLIKYYNS